MIEYKLSPAPGIIQRTIDSLPSDCSDIVIHLLPGVFHEKTVINRPGLTITGSGASQTLLTWSDGARVYLPEDKLNRGTFRTATMRIDGDHITIQNLTIENNSAPRELSGQAIALYADGDFFLCENCTLRSHQDTLFTAPLPPKEIEKNGFIGPKQYSPRIPQRHTYLHCRISGDIDFIFGGAAAWFEACDIVSVNSSSHSQNQSTGYCTAASTPEGQIFGYVFHQCRFVGENVSDGSIYLGRPWRDYAKTVLIKCELGPHIHPEGFHDWNKAIFHSGTGLYAEYQCYGPGAHPETLASFCRQLTEKEASSYTYEHFLVSLDA